MNCAVSHEEVMKVAVQCKACKRVIAYKLSTASGLLRIKCPKCGCEMNIDLSLRRTKVPIFCRRASNPILLPIR